MAVIIWGTRTKREGRGFVIRPCPQCQSEQVHFVAEARSKFTLYFIPTFTTSSKALLVCTHCEWVSEIDGADGRMWVARAVPEQAILAEVRRRASGQGPAGSTSGLSPAQAMAIGAIALAVSAAAADGSIEDNEAAATVRALQTVAEATRSPVVREVASTATDQFSDLLSHILSPLTGEVPVMLAQAGAAARRLGADDCSRYVGQLSWLCHTIASAGSAPPDAALDAMDAGFEQMGFRAGDVASALTFCQANGG